MLQPIPSYQIVPGETVFRLLERLCRQQGLVMTGQPDGSIKFTKTAPGMHAALIEGINCKGLEADHNWAGRHSHVIARGQRASGVGTSSLQIEQLAQDSAVNRYRPVVMVVDGDTDPQRAQQAAKWRQAREAGHSLKATIRVQSFRDDGGTLWTPGNLVPVDSDFLGIQGVMAVERVHWSQSRAAGSVSTLSLCDPRALGGEGGGSAPGGSTNSVWDIGDDSGE
jgi:prophage tail gpP-like protein